MKEQLFLNLKVVEENENITLQQLDDEGMLNKITITPSMINSLVDTLCEINTSLHPFQRESSAKEKGFPSFADLEPVPPPDTECITLTEELIRAGMTGGIGINKKQQSVLNIESLHKGWLQEIVGTKVRKIDYEKFVALKGVTSKEK